MSLPIFPLSNVVLFPGLHVPLHIFEPRYRQMTEAALDTDGQIGMIAVVPEGAVDMSGDPPVFEVGCAGLIRDSQKFPDGRYNIVLEGTRRFRIDREQLPDAERLYRTADVTWMDDDVDAASESDLHAQRARLMQQVDLIARRLGREDATPSSAFNSVGDEVLVNTLANGFDFGTREKQGLLEANGVRERIDRLSGLLEFAIAELDSGRTSNSGSLH